MGSGKSTLALQIHHNLVTRGHEVILATQLDRVDGQVSSRLGVAAKAEPVTPDTNLYAMAVAHYDFVGLDAVICDEVQFYEPAQAEQLARVVDLIGVDVYAFGLLTSFQGEMFPGSARLMELADERNEVQVEARCWCGRRATHNARLVNGRQVYKGALKVVGDTEDRSDADTTYELRCRFHWYEAKWAAEAEQLTLPVNGHANRTPQAPREQPPGDPIPHPSAPPAPAPDHPNWT